MTLLELAAHVGKRGTITLPASSGPGFLLQVTVIDVKQSYGKTRYLVTPIAGSGSVWVENVNFYAEIT